MRRIPACCILIMALVPFLAGAAVPESINYQGYLKQAGVVVNGTKSMTFTLYDAASGGAALCTSGVQSVTVANGLFSYKIGSAGCNLSTVNWDNPVYLEVAIDGVAMTPREQMAGMSYLLQKQASDVAFTPAGDVAAATVQSAIAELDSEKLSKTGGTVTGILTATSFAGDGSALTGINASALDHNTMGSLTTGDVHTQYFNLSQAETVTGIPAFNGGTTGADAPFTVDSTFLVANLNSDLLDGQEGAFYLNTGTAHAGDVTGAFNALDIASGVVGSTEITDNSVTATDLLVNVISSIDGVTNDGGDIDLVAGAGVSITPDDTANTITLAANMGAIDHGSITGLGDDDHTQYVKDAGDTMTGSLVISAASATNTLSVDNTAASGNAIFSTTAGTGVNLDAAVWGQVSGTSGKGLRGTAVGGSGNGVYGESTGSGAAILAFNNSTGNIFEGNVTGSGNMLVLQKNAANKVVIDNNGNLFASGTLTANAFSGDGSALTNITAGSHHHDTAYVNVSGDAMTGPLGLTQSGATATVYAYQTGATDEAGYFEVTNAGSSVAALSGKTAGTAATSYGVYGQAAGSGYGVYGDNNGGGVGVYGYNSSNGIGVTGGAAGTGYGVQGRTTSNGTSVFAYSTGAGATLYGGNHLSTGNLMQLQQAGVDRFVVSNSGAVTATSFSGDGSALTNISAGTHNHDTSYVNISGGDTMTGALTMNNVALNMSGAGGGITFDNAGGAISNSASAVQIADDLNVTGSEMITANLTVDTSTLYVDSTNNRVGIGTASPSQVLTVQTAADGQGMFLTYPAAVSGQWVNFNIGRTLGNVDAAGLSFGYDGSGSGNNRLNFSFINLTPPVLSMRADRNVGISTETPSGRLDVQRTDAGVLYFGNHTSTGNLLQLQQGGVNKFVVDNSGNIIVGGVTDSTKVLKTGDTMTGALTMNNVALNMSGAGGDIIFDNAGGAISNSAGSVLISDDLQVNGTITAGADTGTNGYDVNFYGSFSGFTGGRMYWDASKDAFRAGRDSNGTYWNDANTGLYSLAAGYNTKASGDFSTALSYVAESSGDYSTAIGANSIASGDYSMALGGGTTASGLYSTAMGAGTTAGGNYSTAIGRYATAGAANAVVIGQGVDAGNLLANNTASSLMIGFNSTIPTLYMGPSAGAGTTGKVGIGTTTPGAVGAAKLELYGTAGSPTAGPHIQAVTSSDTYPVFQQLNYGHDNVALNFDAYYDGTNWRSSDAGSNFALYKNNDKMKLAYKSGVAAGSTISFDSGIVLQASNGNVGIGMDTPTNKLHVENSANTGNGAFFHTSNAANTTGQTVYALNAGGTSSRAGYFENSNPANTACSLWARNTGGGEALCGSITNAANTSNAISISTNGEGKAATFSVTNAANTNDTVYIGHAGAGGATTAALEAETTNSAHAIYAHTSGTAGRAGKFIIDNAANDNDVLYIETASVVGGTTLGRLIDTNKGAYLTNTGIWTDASSRQYKKDITPLTPDDVREILDVVKGIEVVRYRYKDETPDQKMTLGVIAEDAPDEMTDDTKTGVQTVKAVGMLIAAMQAQQQLIEELQQEIENLKKAQDD